jgi:hypothetical protein
MNRRLPVPQVQAFVVCREIWSKPGSQEFLLADPRSHLPLQTFPADVILSVYVHLTGGHGNYPLEFLLRNSAGENVWDWEPPELLEHPDPLEPQQLFFQDLVVHVPRAGRYELALLAGGEEIGRQPLLVGTKEMLGG